MTREELVEFLKDNLDVELTKWYDYEGWAIKVELKLQDTVICTDYIILPDNV